MTICSLVAESDSTTEIRIVNVRSGCNETKLFAEPLALLRSSVNPFPVNEQIFLQIIAMQQPQQGLAKPVSQIALYKKGREVSFFQQCQNFSLCCLQKFAPNMGTAVFWFPLEFGKHKQCYFFARKRKRCL